MPRYSLKLILFFLIFAPLDAAAQTEGVTIEKLWDIETGAANFGGVRVEGNTLYSGGEDGILRAIDVSSGEVVWSHETGAAIGSNATVDDQRVYFHTRDGVVHAVSKEDGSALWTFATKGERRWDAWDYYLSTPSVDDRQIYFGSGDHHVYALNKRTGVLRWKVKTGNIIHGEPLISGEKVIVGGFEGRLYAFDRANGKTIWSFKTVGTDYFRNGEIPGAAVAKDGLVYFGGRDYNIYALLEETGTGAWNHKTPSWIVGSPLATGDDLIVVNSDGSMVFSYNNRTGRENWQFKNSYNMFAGAAALGTAHIAVAGLDGRITLLTKDKGEVAGLYETDGSAANRTRYFNEEGDLDFSGVRSLEDLIALYERQLADMGGIPGSIAVASDVIFYATVSGQIAAIKVGGIELPAEEGENAGN